MDRTDARSQTAALAEWIAGGFGMLGSDVLASGTGERLLALVETAILGGGADRLADAHELRLELAAQHTVFGVALPAAAIVATIAGSPPTGQRVRAGDLKPIAPPSRCTEEQRRQIEAPPDILVMPDVLLTANDVTVERSGVGLRFSLPALKGTLRHPDDSVAAWLRLPRNEKAASPVACRRRRLLRDRLVASTWLRDDGTAIRPALAAPQVLGVASDAEWAFRRDLVTLPAQALVQQSARIGFTIPDWPYAECPDLIAGVALVGVSGSAPTELVRLATADAHGEVQVDLRHDRGIVFLPESVRANSSLGERPLRRRGDPAGDPTAPVWEFDPRKQVMLLAGLPPGGISDLRIVVRYVPGQKEDADLGPGFRGPETLRFEPVEVLGRGAVGRQATAGNNSGAWLLPCGAEIATRADLVTAIADYDPFPGVFEFRLEELTLGATAFRSKGELELGLTVTIPLTQSRDTTHPGDRSRCQALLEPMLRRALQTDMPLRVVLADAD